MTKKNACNLPALPDELLEQYGLRSAEYLGGRLNKHWMVTGSDRFVLRKYSEETTDIHFELRVLEQLHAMGWPVAKAVSPIIQIGGDRWCLFEFLPGQIRDQTTHDEALQRGRLLAELHESMFSIGGMRQRQGFVMPRELVLDPELHQLISRYEKSYPETGHILRWHLDQTNIAFNSLDLPSADVLVIHSDFARWNILFDDARLTGVLDFEATHVNYRVADFALSWRGDRDEVIEGYEQVHPLSELEKDLILPVYWAWIFMGIKPIVRQLSEGRLPSGGIDWQIRHLLKRSNSVGVRFPRYVY